MVLEFKRMLSTSWGIAAKISATWAVMFGAALSITSAVQFLAFTIIVLLVIIPITLLLPILVGYLATRRFAAGAKMGLVPGAVNAAVGGFVYALVFIAIALVFIVVNYSVATILWGMSSGIGGALETLGEGILVVLATVGLGIPIFGGISAIAAAVGGAIYSFTKK